MTEPTDWEQAVEQQRANKDEFFGNHPRSPIPQRERDAFEGLHYFPPDRTYRYELELEEYDETETVVIGTTTEGEREYAKWGQFHFEVDGEPCTLQAYKADPHEQRLWVPFRDETNGEETYGAGRYLDLEYEEHHTDDDTWVVDFNAAYNPFCAYSEVYECALIPMENWLDVRIEAGEKNFETDEGHEAPI